MEFMMPVLKYVFQFSIVVGSLYVIILTGAYVFQGNLLFIPGKEMIATPESVGLDYRDHYFETADGVKLHGWFIPGGDSNKFVQLSHGNAGNISGRVGLASVLNEAGFNVFMYDYRGYGKSEGHPSEQGLYKDAEGAMNFLKTHYDVKNENIIQFGRSLGGAVASYVAAKHKTGGLVIDSSFTNMRSIIGEVYPFIPASLSKFKFPTTDYLSDIKGVPVLILHSRDDDLIGFHHGKELYATASEPKQFVTLNGGHNDSFLVTKEKYLDAWREFKETLENEK